MNIKTEPCPGSLSNHILPPWNSTKRFVMVRPIPIPSYSLMAVFFPYLERGKKHVLHPRHDAGPGVLYRYLERAVFIFPNRLHGKLYRAVGRSKLNGIVKKIVEYLPQHAFVRLHRSKAPVYGYQKGLFFCCTARVMALIASSAIPTALTSFISPAVITPEPFATISNSSMSFRSS